MWSRKCTKIPHIGVKYFYFSLLFSHTHFPQNSAALSLVSWINPLRQHVFTSTDATLEKKKRGKGAKWVLHFNLAASCQHVPQKKRKKEKRTAFSNQNWIWNQCKTRTVKPSECQKDWRKRLVAKMTSLTYLSTLSRTWVTFSYPCLPSNLWQFCHSYLLSTVIFWDCLKCETRK